MVTLPPPGPWQVMDEELGVLFPWYTKSFLDVLKTWDFKGKKVFEYGVGHSSVWYQKRGAHIYGVEESVEWAGAINEATGCAIVKRILQEGRRENYAVASLDFSFLFDYIIVDGDRWRDECISMAVSSIKDGGILIVDNWLQPSVWMAYEGIRILLSQYESHIFKQEGHPDWQTAYWVIKKNKL